MPSIQELEQELEKQIEISEQALKANHVNVENIFYETRKLLIGNSKSYLTNISTICATIIPFSSLVFTIPSEILKINITLWGLSLLIFIIALSMFIECFLKLIESERKVYVQLLFSWIESGAIDLINITSKNNIEKTTEHIKIFKSQEKFSQDAKKGIEEEDFVILGIRIKRASYLFIMGLVLFFLSIFLNKFIQSIITF